MFAYNWAIITQDSRQSAITMDQWGLNSLPYFDYDLDNFAINPAGNALFYTYQYRVGQVWQPLLTWFEADVSACAH